MNILESLNPNELGRELQNARKKRGLTQEEAAKIIEVARTTLTAIEKGERRVQAHELFKLARAYGRQVSDFVRPRPQLSPFQVQFRGPSQPDTQALNEITADVARFEELCRKYLELEKITDSPFLQNYPPEYKGARTEQGAESLAITERNRLGFGDGPLPALRDVLELEVGLRIFCFSIADKYSEIYHYDEQLGGCLVFNSNHPEERRRWSLAHGYAHFLCDRGRDATYVEGTYQRIPENERFADSFAGFFLMPSSSVSRRYNDIKNQKNKMTPAGLCTLAYYYGVSVEAMAARLEDVKLLPTGTWKKLIASGFKVREAQKQLNLDKIPARDQLLPTRYQNLAVDAFDRGLVTEGQFARFLEVDDLVEARRIAQHGSFPRGRNADPLNLIGSADRAIASEV
jgi:Zn-dependent peptidase ImmA (M78 family)/DNA-binding XRE family transcriptional regulator